MRRHNLKKLRIWQEGMSIVQITYKIVKTFPDFEKFNLIEGTSKKTDRHFIQYLENSLGSFFEWETQIIVAYNEGYISEMEYNSFAVLIQELQKMISGFIDGLEKKS